MMLLFAARAEHAIRKAGTQLGFLFAPRKEVEKPGSRGGRGYWDHRGRWQYGERPAPATTHEAFDHAVGDAIGRIKAREKQGASMPDALTAERAQSPMGAAFWARVEQGLGLTPTVPTPPPATLSADIKARADAILAKLPHDGDARLAIRLRAEQELASATPAQQPLWEAIIAATGATPAVPTFTTGDKILINHGTMMTSGGQTASFGWERAIVDEVKDGRLHYRQVKEDGTPDYTGGFLPITGQIRRGWDMPPQAAPTPRPAPTPAPTAIARPTEAKTYASDPKAQPWEVLEADYCARQVDVQKMRAARNVEGWTKELGTLRPGTKKHTEVSGTLRYWEGEAARLAAHDPQRLEQIRRNAALAYLKLVKDGISKGMPVPEAVIAQSQEYQKAADARARWEKGRHTSFANVSVAVDASMQAKRGYKVKRQDGKRITLEQKAEIATGIDELEAVLGPLKDIMEGANLTIAHTSGKFPFLSTAGGMYHRADRTITIGIMNRFRRKPIPSLAHEFGHFLDGEAGALQGVDVSIGGGYYGRTKITRSSSLAEKDARNYRDGGEGEKLLRQATERINDTIQVRRLQSSKLNAAATDDERADIEDFKVSLGPYWRLPNEVWARLVEQHVATKLGKGGVSMDSPERYGKRPGYWKPEVFAELAPMVERELQRRIGILRAAATTSGPVPAAQSSPQRSVLHAEHAGPIRKGARFLAYRDQGDSASRLGRPSVSGLPNLRRPPEIVRAVRSVIVDAIERVRGRGARPDVSEKVLETVPALADRDPASSVVGERGIPWVFTTLQHRNPGCVDRGAGHPMRAAVGARGATLFAKGAAAAGRGPVAEADSGATHDHAAFASTDPATVTPRAVVSLNDETPEGAPSEILKAGVPEGMGEGHDAALAHERTQIEAALYYLDDEDLPKLDGRTDNGSVLTKARLLTLRASLLNRLGAIEKARKLHYRRSVDGVDMSIENRRGSHRHWTDHDGTKGVTKLTAAYGYARGTRSPTDRDHLDVFLGPLARTGQVEGTTVYVITTNKPPDFATLDEQKAMVGFPTLEAARAAFLENYSGDARFIRQIDALPWAQFKADARRTGTLPELLGGEVVERGRLLQFAKAAAPAAARPTAQPAEQPPAPRVAPAAMAGHVAELADVLERALPQVANLFPGVPLAGRVKETATLARKVAAADPAQDLEGAEDTASLRLLVDSEEDAQLAVKRLQRLLRATNVRDYIARPLGLGARGIDCAITIEGRPLEVQIRTARQVAWSDYAHDVAVKTRGTVPPEVRDYLRGMSEAFAAADRGEAPAELPECPEVLQTMLGPLAEPTGVAA